MTTLSVWSEDGARVGDVLGALEDLRRPEPMPATRTSVLTLVIVATRQESAARAQSAIHELGGRHPARVLTLLLDPAASDAPIGLDARIRLLGGATGGKALWFEDIELVVHGEATEHLHSLIEPMTLSDLPVVVWFVDELPAVDDPLLAAADVLLVDARSLGDDCFASLDRLVARRPVVDLSWVRLQPWRELLAGLFEGPAFRPFVHHVRHAEVLGRTGPRSLLAGWVADRLELPERAVHLGAAEHVTIRLHCDDGRGGEAAFEVTRLDGGRMVQARAHVVGGPTSEAVLELPEATPAWGLPDALARLERDPLYERALHRALS